MDMRVRKNVNRSAFTLIELLVVIAIIAILAAILFPIYASIKENGRIANCNSNLHNISRALEMYRDDNNGTNCYIWQNQHGGYSSSDQGCFFWVITRYAGQRMEVGNSGKGNAARANIYKCPSAPWLRQELQTPWVHTNTGFAYSMNETGWSDKSTHYLYAGGGLKDSMFRRPTQIIFVTESMGWSGYGIGYGNGKLFDNEKPGDTDGWTSKSPPPGEVIPLVNGPVGPHGGSLCKIYNIRTSHTDGAMMLFYDGHTRLMTTTLGSNWRVDM